MRSAAIVVVLGTLVGLPAAVARADDPCAAEDALITSLCRASRPLPTISATPTAPRLGSEVKLQVGADGRGLVYAWDLDGDGEYDDATGEDAVVTFTGGTPVVGVRATDQFGRVGTERLRFAPHLGNASPNGVIELSAPSARVGRPITVTAHGQDPDGQLAKVELDLDGDGVYETPGPAATTTYATPGTRTIHARFTDDAGATATASTTLDVHTQNLPPTAYLNLSQADGSTTIGRPLLAGGALVDVYASDSDGSIAGFDFDLDGDGAYETHVDAGAPLDLLGTRGEAKTTFAPGDHEIGVRVTDVDGATTTVRESVAVVAAWPITGEHAPPVVVDWAGAVARPGVPIGLSAANLEAGPVTYAWDADGDGDFDDGSGPQIQFSYPAAGSYLARVRAAGPGGARIAFATVLVRDPAALPPVLSSLTLPRAVRAGHAAAFTAHGSTVDGGPGTVTLTWDTDDDGQFDDDPSNASLAGPTTVSVKATDADARSAIETAQIVPAPGDLGPLASWVSWPYGFPDPAAMGSDLPMFLPGRDTDFSGFGDDADGGGCCAIAWDDDGDGAFDDGAGNDHHRTFTAGERTVGVRATDADGASSEAVRTFGVGTRPPKASFTAADGVVTSTSTDPDGDAIASVAWDLDGDRAFDDAAGPSATALVGEHLVGVAVTDAGGDVGIAYAHVTGVEQPVVEQTVVERPPAPPVAAGPVPPRPIARLTLSVSAGTTLEHSARKLTVTVRCAAACRPVVVVKLGSHVLARKTAHAGGRLSLTLSAKARRLLRATRSRTLTITVSAAGAKTVRKTVQLRR